MSGLNCSISPIEYQTLHNFYTVTGGANWKVPTTSHPWNFSTGSLYAPCATPWAGISCGFQNASNPIGFCNVLVIQLSGYKLTGTLPATFTNLELLQYLDISGNSIKGSLPDSWGNFNSMEVLGINKNRLSGTLPNSWSNMTSMLTLYANRNSFTGTLPNCWSTWSDAHIIFLYTNFLTGTLPSVWSTMSQMQAIGLDSNFLSGTMPSSWATMNNLQILYMYTNSLTGTLPSAWSTMVDMQTLYVYRNGFSGTFPSLWSSMVSIQVLYIFNTYIQGTIPSSWTVFSCIQQLYLFSNNLSGNPGVSSVLAYLRLDYNYFSGRNDKLYLPNLQYLNLSENYFSGDISFLTRTVLPKAYMIDLSQNKYSGTIPWLHLKDTIPNIQALVLSGNCFSGQILDDVCKFGQMNTLILDNLADSGQCGLNSFLERRFMQGSLPECIFQMPTLETLHAMGNGLEGTLSDIIRGGNLTVLALTSNYIHGTIPDTWQDSGQWSQLQLSYNKISGFLFSDFNVSSTVKFMNLSANRLSGRLPNSFEILQSMDVVEGNIFECSSNYGNDVNAAIYSCGSQSLQFVFYAFIIVMMIVLVIFMSTYPIREIVLMTSELRMNSNLKRISSVCTVVIALLLIIRSIMTSVDRSTTAYYDLYGWITTMVFVHSTPPIIIILLIVGLSIYVTLQLGITTSNDNGSFFVPAGSRRRNTKVFLDKYDPSKQLLDRFRYRSVFLQLVNIAVISTVTFVYIFIVLSEATAVGQIFFSIALAFFKVFWNVFYVNWMVKEVSKISFHKTFVNELFAGIISFIISPLIVILITDVKCLKYLVTSIASVLISYNIQVPICTISIIVNIDGGYTTTTYCQSDTFTSVSSINPPWLYSYQCSSSMITEYVPVVFYSYLIYLLLIPGVKLWVLLKSRSERIEHCKGLANGMLPILLTTVNLSDLEEVRDVVASNAIRITSSTHSRIMRHFLVFLLFGLAAPILGLIIIFTIIVEDILIQAQLHALRRDLRDATTVDDSTITSIISSVFLSNALENYRIYFPKLLIVIILYWCFFLYDMIADTNGYVRGMIASGALFAVYTTMTFLSWYYLNYQYLPNARRTTISSNDSSIRESELVLSDSFRSILTSKVNQTDVRSSARTTGSNITMFSSNREGDDSNAVTVELNKSKSFDIVVENVMHTHSEL